MPSLRNFWLADRSLTVLLGLLSTLIFVIHPLNQLGAISRVVIGVFFSLILISGVGAVAKNPLVMVSVGILVVATIVTRWLRLSVGGLLLDEADVLLSAVLSLILAAVVLYQVVRQGPITGHRIQGAVAVYMLLGLAWAFAYQWLLLYSPDAFVFASTARSNPSDDPTSHFVYFSFVTLTTVGFGDIAAVHPIARAMVTLEALIGQLFPAILLARLVAMEVAHRHSRQQ